jgi:hypothetical protein
MFDQIAKKYGVMNYAMGGPVMMSEGGLTAEQLRAQIEAGPRTQAALDQALLSYTPAQMAAAFPEYGGVADYNNAAREAYARQEQQQQTSNRDAVRADMAARGEEFRIANPGGDVQISSPAYPTMSAIPQSEFDAARAKLTPEQANFIDWQMRQIDPMQHQKLTDIYARQGSNPYLNGQRAQEQIDRAQRRFDMFAEAGVAPGDIAPWMDPNWRTKQDAKDAADEARRQQQLRDAANSPFVTVGGGVVSSPIPGGGGGGGGGGGTTPPPGGGGTPPGPGPGQPPPFTPPPVYQPPAPFTGPGGTIYPNSIQTPQGPQPTYFPTSWWTSSPTASNAYGRTTGSTARNFDAEMVDYRAKYAPVFTRPTPPPPILAPAANPPNQATKPAQDPGPGMEWFWNGAAWVVRFAGQNDNQPGSSSGSGGGGDSGAGAGAGASGSGTGSGVGNSGEGGGGPGTGGWARGGEVNKLWNKYHGR